jgi:hypothetical protein
MAVHAHAEAASGDPNQGIKWNTTTANRAIFHSITRQNSNAMIQIKDKAEDAVVYYGMLQACVSHLTLQGVTSLNLYMIGRRGYTQNRVK